MKFPFGCIPLCHDAIVAERYVWRTSQGILIGSMRTGMVSVPTVDYNSLFAELWADWSECFEQAPHRQCSGYSQSIGYVHAVSLKRDV